MLIQIPAQLADGGTRFRLGNDIGDQAPLNDSSRRVITFTFGGQSDGLPNRSVPLEDCLDCSKLNPEAPHLHLTVDPSEEIDVAIR
jgi:hypothetical protein